MCEILYNCAVKENVELVMCGMFKDYKHSSKSFKYYIKEKRYCGEECKWLQEQILHYNGNIATAYCKLINVSFLQNNNIEHDEILKQGAEGIEFNIRLFDKISSAYFINVPLYHYIYNENSISASHNEEYYDLILKCFEKMEYTIAKSENYNNLFSWYQNRLLYVAMTVAINGYFNPSNMDSFKEKKQKLDAFLQRPVIKTALLSNNQQGLSFQRKLALFCLKHKLYVVLNFLGKIRNWQKLHG